jgi:hypothetical protein
VSSFESFEMPSIGVHDLGVAALCYVIFALFTGVRSESILHTICSTSLCLGAAFLLSAFRKKDVQLDKDNAIQKTEPSTDTYQEAGQENSKLTTPNLATRTKAQYTPKEEAPMSSWLEGSRSGWLYVRSAKWKKLGRERWKYRFVKLDRSTGDSCYMAEYYKKEFDGLPPRARLLMEEFRVERVTNSKQPFVFELCSPQTVHRFCTRTEDQLRGWMQSFRIACSESSNGSFRSPPSALPMALRERSYSESSNMSGTSDYAEPPLSVQARRGGEGSETPTSQGPVVDSGGGSRDRSRDRSRGGTYAPMGDECDDIGAFVMTEVQAAGVLLLREELRRRGQVMPPYKEVRILVGSRAHACSPSSSSSSSCLLSLTVFCSLR